MTSIQVPGTQSLTFTYDAANRITGIRNGIDPSATENLGYDAQSRLTSVFRMSGTNTYQYDADGNRTGQTVGGSTSTFNIAANSNRLLGVSGALSTQYGYDAQGNTTTVASNPTYHYNAFNRMDSAGSTSNTINPEGQRLRKQGPGATTYFAPSRGNALMAEKSGSSWIDYVWLNGRLIGRVHNGRIDAIHDDQVGRPEVMTNAAQAVIWYADNKPFTRDVLVNDSSTPLNLGFPGQYYDANTWTWNNGFRDYNAGLGRYLESDPIGLDGGVNTYAYVNENPIGKIDPLGLESPIGDP